MHYYEHHIGDYAEATAHLSFIEDAAYSRLIRKYYSSESPLPADLKAVQRLVGARSKAERAAVKSVLEEFFQFENDGWHNKRCDDEISRFRNKAAAGDTKRENEKERQQRSRGRRKELFSQLKEHGITPRWNAPMAELEAHLSRVTARVSHSDDSVSVTDTSREKPRLSHSPIPNPQSPIPTIGSGSSVTGAGKEASEEESGTDPPAPSRDFRLWQEIRSAYPAGAYPQTDWLLAERAARMAVGDGLTTLEDWLAAVKRYAEQQGTLGNVGTRYVRSPLKFFSVPSWQEEFPPPAAQSGNGKKPYKRARTTAELEAEARANGWLDDDPELATT